MDDEADAEDIPHPMEGNLWMNPCGNSIFFTWKI
jgi:hypothetical protein